MAMKRSPLAFLLLAFVLVVNVLVRARSLRDRAA